MNLPISIFLGFLLFVLSVSEVSAKRLKGIRSLSSTAHGYRIVSSPVRAGKRSQRFEVRPGDCGSNRGWSDCKTDRERSEFSITKKWRYGSNHWIGYSVFVPNDFKTSNKVRTTVGQIKAHGGPKGRAGGYKSFPGVMQMEMLGDRYFFRAHILSGSANNVRNEVRDFPLIAVSAMRGKWTDIEINFDTSKGEELMVIYINGSKVAAISNWIKFSSKRYYFKYGIYRSFVSRHRKPMPSQVLYFDEVKMGSRRRSVKVNRRRPVD